MTKIAFISGSSRGIGAEIAINLAKEGYHVIINGRNLDELEKIDDKIQEINGSCSIANFDIKDFDKIDQLGHYIAKTYGRIDVFIANAAILGSLTPIAHIQPKNWQEIIDINLTANYRFIRSFDSILKTTENSRVVFLTSSVATTNKEYWGAYSISKSGLEALAKTYANESKYNSIKINIFDPGATRTRMRAEAMPGEEKESVKPASEIIKYIKVLISKELKDSGKLFKYEDFANE